MASLTDIRTAIKTVLEAALTGVTVYPRPAGQVNVPAIIVKPADANFDVSLARGTDSWQLDLTVLVAKADDVLAQEKLDPYVDGGGSSSVRKAIFDNKSLGLTDTNAHVSGMSDYDGQHVVGAETYAGAVLRLIVHTKPS